MSKKRSYAKKPTETTVQKINKCLSGSSYYARVSYDTIRCMKEGHSYCSCATIENAKVENIDVKGFIKNIVQITHDPIERYCIDRILHINYKIKDIHNWKPDVHGGYYGEECSGGSLFSDVRDQLCFNMTELFSRAACRDKIFYTLELEYGYLADIIKNAKDFQIVNVEKEQLIIPNQDYARRLNMDLVNEYSDHNLPIGIYIEQQTKPVKYRLVDGTHRTMAFLKSKRIRADIFVTKF